MSNNTGVEEIVHPKFDIDKLNKVVIPMMANGRMATNGKIDPDEIQRQVLYATSAGNRQSDAFNQMKDVGKKMLEGKSAFLIGADYTLGSLHGQLDERFINDQRETFSVYDFQREYENIWTGSSDRALVDTNVINDCRIIEDAEDTSVDKNAEYILAYDVARSTASNSALSALSVIKIKKRNSYEYTKQLINMHSHVGEHFLEQALFLKKMVNKYNAKMLIVDSNGLGKGVVDYLVTDIDANPVYEVVNNSQYDEFKTPNSIPVLFLISTNQKEYKNSDIFNNFTSQVNNGKFKMLQHSQIAKLRLMEQRGMKDNNDKLGEALRPYIMVDLLADEITNLEYKQSSVGTAVEQISRNMPKDKFMSLCYGLYWIYLEEQRNKLLGREEFAWDDFFLK